MIAMLATRFLDAADGIRSLRKGDDREDCLPEHHGSGERPARSPGYAHVRAPIAIGGMVARNRVMMATHGPRLSQPRYLRYLEERARGGIGLAGFNLGPLGLMQFPFGPGRGTTGAGGDADGVPFHPLSAEGRAHYDSLIPVVAQWAQAVKDHGVRAVGQLYHPGAAQHSDNFQPTVSASTVIDEYEKHRPHPLSGQEIADLLEAYSLAARRAVEAGFDAIELHGAHGYLIQQFLSPLLNRRDDQWGGSLENRMRFLVSVLRTVRGAVDGAIPVGVRLTGLEPEGGLTIADLQAVARRIEAEGGAYVSISGGSYSGLWKGAGLAYVASALTAPGPNVPVSAAIREAVTIPVMVSGGIVSLDQAEDALAQGHADAVCMVRALMADPALVEKGLSGRGGAARPCIGGNECHYGRPLACAVNPRAGREAELEAAPTETPKRVLVVGGGPAGMECAVTLAERGHAVILVEREAELGGVIAPLARVSRQSRFRSYLDDIRHRIHALPIDLRLGMRADAALVASIGPDVIVVATGAAWPDAIGIPATQAIRAPDAVAQRVTIVGGKDDHLGPLVTSDFFASHGRSVTLLTEGAYPGQGVEAASFFALMRRLHEQGVEIRPFTAAVSMADGALATRHTLTKAAELLPDPGTVINFENRTADAGAAALYAPLAPAIHVIGDALSPRRMVHATLDGVRLGNQIA
jgi:2,4-dienoyl-CoA reductase-like NADH-dependent reductase (Old Yellow Enzyme family)